MRFRPRKVAAAATILVVTLALAAVLWRGAGLPWTVAGLTSFLVMGAILPVVMLARRARGTGPSTGTSAGVEAELARLSDRLRALEERIEEVDRRAVDFSRSTIQAVASELDQVGAMVRDLAETVALLDAELFTPRSGSIGPDIPANVALAAQDDGPGRSHSAARWSDQPVPDQQGDEIFAAVASAIRAQTVDILLQAVVTLPQRRVRLYEARPRVRLAGGGDVDGERVQAMAQGLGLGRDLDRFVLRHVLRVARHLAARNRDVPVVFGATAPSLLDAGLFRILADAFGTEPSLASRLLFRIPLADFRDAGALEREALEALAGLGVRFVIDSVPDLVLDGRSLAQRGVRFVKVAADVVLAAAEGRITAEIHPADLAGYLSRSGITLVVAGVETEAASIEVFEFDIPLGIGAAYAPARAVRLDVLDEPAPKSAGTAEGGEPASATGGSAPQAAGPRPVPASPPPSEDGEGPQEAELVQARPRGTPFRAFLRRTSG
jgi:cyclic-di-GMP phosphodiesterase TipF (flagellum assembly factor)